jgi:hypothetical protein
MVKSGREFCRAAAAPTDPPVPPANVGKIHARPSPAGAVGSRGRAR